MRRLVWAASSCALSLAACAQLDPIANGCGNAIVEANEDCDSHSSDAKAHCAAPDEANACRYVCASADGKTAYDCPAGYLCGLDSVCRGAPLSFAASAEPIPAAASDLFVADFDGDGRGDVLATGSSETTLSYFDANANRQSTVRLLTGLPAPSAGRLTSAARNDLTFSTDLGVGVLRGQSDRTLDPAAYPSITFPPGSKARFFGLVTNPATNGSKPDLEPIIGIQTGDKAAIARVDQNGTGGGKLMISLKVDLDDLVEGSRIAHIIEDPSIPCGEVVMAFRGGDAAYVFPLCAMQAGSLVWNDPAADGTLLAPPAKISLPAATPIASNELQVADLDGDGHLDVLVAASVEGKAASFAAYGLGDGSFASTPAPAPPGDDAMGAFSFSADADGPPLAIGDLNGDGKADFVASNGVFLSSGGSLVQVVSLGAVADPWTVARIADLNGNGIPDVVAGRSSSAGIDFLNGTTFGGQTVFNTFSIPTQHGVRHFAIGDFDGDLVNDLAFAECGEDNCDEASQTSASSPADSPSVAFGRAAGAPELPASMGKLPNILQVMSGDLNGSGTNADANTDLAVIARRHDAKGDIDSISILVGRGDRLLLSPFGFSHIAPGGAPGDSVQGQPVRSVVAELTGDADADLASFEVDQPKAVDKGKPTFRLWFARGTGDGALDATVKNAPPALALGLPGNPETVRRSVMAVGDTAGDGKATVVLLTPTMAGSELTLAKPTKDAGGDWVLQAAKPIAIAGVSLLGADRGHMELCDVDGDGKLDLVLLGERENAEIDVFWNDGAGGFDVGDPATILPPSGALYSFAVIRRGREAAQIVLIDDAGAYVATAAGRSFATPEVLSGVRHGDGHIAAGDVDGDGVDDLAVAVEGEIHTYKGAPKVP